MIVNFKQTIGLIILSIGIVLMIYSFRESEDEILTGALILGSLMAISGATMALLLNRK